MVDYREFIQRQWFSETGRVDKAPQLVVGQSEYEFLINAGCAADLLHLHKPIPTILPIPQSRDWYRKHG